jgi:hypothetical protein
MKSWICTVTLWSVPFAGFESRMTSEWDEYTCYVGADGMELSPLRTHNSALFGVLENLPC